MQKINIMGIRSSVILNRFKTDWLIMEEITEEQEKQIEARKKYYDDGFYVTKNCPIAYHAFAEYKSYWFKKSSTPTAGVKLGYGGVIMTVEDFHSDAFVPYGEYKVEPYIGWDWGLKSGKGLSLSLGANILMNNLFTDNAYAIVLPKLSIGISF